MKKGPVAIIALSILLFACMIAAAGVGAFTIPPAQIFSILLHQLGINQTGQFTDQQQDVFLFIRLPRVLLCALVGGGLAIAGCCMQALFHNPMAEPGITGSSAGASLFVALFIILFNTAALPDAFANYIMAFIAFAGALLTTVIVYRIAVTGQKTNHTTFLLAGVAINAIAMSLVGLCIYTADDAQLRSITFWNLGSLGAATWQICLIVCSVIVIPCFLLIKKYSSIFNIWSLGEEASLYIGIDIKKRRREIMILCSVITGACVAFTGIIGFIGLVMPHLFRLTAGPDHKHLLPGSALLGATVLIAADLFSRTIVAPAELPVGIITTFIGAPYFLYLITRQKKPVFN